MKTRHDKTSNPAPKGQFGRLFSRRLYWMMAIALAGLFAVLASLFVPRAVAPPAPAAPMSYLEDRAGLLSPGFAAAKNQYVKHLSRTMRIALTLLGLVFAAGFAFALAGIAAGIPAALMLPWRVYSSPILRTFRSATVKAQFSPKNFFARPPPFLTSLIRELQLDVIFNSIYLLAAIVIGIAFLFVGSSIFIGGMGHYGGGGVSLTWTAFQ